MKAWKVCAGDGLRQSSDAPMPEPGPGELLVQVEMCGLNPADLWMVRRGVPRVLGADIVGVVVGEGGECSRGLRGSRIVVKPCLECLECYGCVTGATCLRPRFMGRDLDGGLAEFVSVPESAAVSVPDAVPVESVAAAPMCYLTAWEALINKARVQATDRVFIWGGTGGVGNAAIQTARWRGCVKIGAAISRLEARLIVEKAGATETRDDTGAGSSGEYSVVVNPIGGESVRRSLEMLTAGGMVFLVGAAGDDRCDLSASECFTRQLSIIGCRPAMGQELVSIVRLIEDGVFAPTIDRVFRFEDAAAALSLLSVRGRSGKLLVRVAEALV